MWIECTNCEKTGHHVDFEKQGMDRVCPDCGGPTRITSKPDDAGGDA